MKVGLVILIVQDKQLQRAPRYTEIRERAQWAEGAGFDSLWLYDHLLYREQGKPTTGIWECWTVLSALAEATRRVELGTLVACNSFRNPAILAKMAVTLDEVSQGRFILGLGAGWNKPEYEAFGLPFDHRASRLEEALQIIRPLLREGHVDFAGKYYQARNCEIKPRGPSKNGPPIMIGGDGPRLLRLTAQYADLWNIGYLPRPAALNEPRAKLHAACAQVGRDPVTLGLTVLSALAFPDLTELPDPLDEYLHGSTTEIAAAMKGFEQLGVEQLMLHCIPGHHPSVMARLSEILSVYRQMK